MDHTTEDTPATADTESAPDRRADSVTRHDADTPATGPDAAALPTPLAPGDRVDHFRVMRLLGRGGMGEVYLARDETLGRKVALKRIRPRRAGDRAELDALLREARAIARCNHPHIVTVYAVGDVDGAPYMALEYLEGRDLAERLQRQPPGVAEALRVAAAVADALAEAHRHGVLHRDLKPSNIMQPVDGRLRVVDFGLARLEEPAPAPSDAPPTDSEARPSGIGGTPGYMAPEQWTQAECTPATDVWALGVLLFEMCSGRRPFEGRSVHALAFATAGPDPAPRLDALAEVPEALADLVARCLAKPPAERPPLVEVQATLARLRSPDRPVDDEEGPFRGLEPFTEAQAGLFFGRDAELRIAVDRLDQAPILPLVGPSGAGKSSLVHAGLVPRLRERTRLRLVTIRPGPDPFATLARRLASARTQTTNSLAAAADPDGSAPDARGLATHPRSLGQALRRLAVDTGARVVLFVDQLEEAFTLAPPDVGSAFVEAICLAADDPADPVRVIFTLREEFVSRVAAARAGRQALTDLMVVLRPDPDALVEILRRPLALVGYRFEDDALPREMVEAVGDAPAGLALLEFAAGMLWHARDRERRLLTRVALDEIGGVAGVLARHADGVLAGLSADAQRTARAVLVQLVTADDTRRTVAEPDLGRGLADAAEVVERLVDARLLSRRRVAGEAALRVELTHESLLTHWARLRQWIDESRDERRALREVEQAAALWHRRGRRASELWTDEALRDARRALDRASTPVPAEVHAFVGTGEQAVGRRRQRRTLLVAAVIGGLGLLVAALAVQTADLGDRTERLAEQSRLAEKRRDAARTQEAAALRASAAGAVRTGRVLDARALLRASLEIEDHPTARTLWEAVDRDPVRASWPLGTYLYSARFDPTFTRVAAGGLDGTLRVLDTRDGSIRMLRGAGDQVLTTAWSADGRTVFGGVWHAGHPMAWDVESGRARAVPAIEAERIDDIIVDPQSGRIVVDGFDHVAWCDPPCTESHVISRGRLGAAAMAPGGRWVAIGHEDGRVELHDLDATEPPRVIARLTRVRQANRMAFTDGGRTLIMLDWPATVLAVDVPAGGEPQTIVEVQGRVRRLAVSSDGRWIGLGQVGGRVQLVERATGDVTELDRHTYQVNGVAFDDAGRRLLAVSGGGTVRVFDLPAARAEAARAERQAGHDWRVQWGRFAPDGRSIHTGGLDRKIFRWTLDGRATLQWPKLGQFIPILAHATTGDSLAVLRSDGRLIRHEGGRRIALGDDPTLKLVGIGVVEPDRIIAFSSTDAWLFGAGAPQALGWGRDIHAIATHPDGRTALVTRGRGRMSRRPLDGGPPLWDARVFRTPSYAVAASPDGQTLYSADLSGRLVALRASDGAILSDVTPAAGVRLYDVALDPTGRTLYAAASNGRIVRQDLATGAIDAWPAHRHETNDIEISPDGRHLLSVADDGTVRLFELPGMRPIWRAPLSRRDGDAVWVATHRGWHRPETPDAGPPAWADAPWARAAVAGRRGATAGDVICLIDAERQLVLHHGVEAERAVPGPFADVAATATGCLALRDDDTGSRLVLVPPDAAPRPLDAGAPVQALVGRTAGFAVLADRRVELFGGDGSPQGGFTVEADASAIAETGDGRWLVGYRAGDFEVRSAERAGVLRPPPITGRPSPVARLVEGPGGLLVAGHEDGTVRLWSGPTPLRDERLHGPITHLAFTPTHVVAASELGQSLAWSLATLTTDRCTFLRRVWAGAPATWVRDRPRVRVPAADHPCAATD